jgi:glucose dehydrogenase
MTSKTRSELKGSLKTAVAATLLCGTIGSAFANQEVLERSKDPEQWGAPGSNYALQRHSTLSDINKDNVSKLQMMWSTSSGTLRGHEGQPVVIKDVAGSGKPMMFSVSGWPNIVQAQDLSDPDNPKMIWQYKKTTDRDESAVPRACCDTVHRGLTYVDGKIVTHTLDGFVVVLDALTGKEVWVVKHAYPEHGETITGPVMVAENLVIAGFGGDEFAARGRLECPIYFIQ